MSMKTPKNRREFETHINIAAEQLNNGGVEKIFFPRLLQSLLKASKPLPNNRVNFLLIDEQVRLYVNSLATFDLMGIPKFPQKQ